MAKATVYFRTLLNPNEVNKTGWEAAKYEHKKVSEVEFEDSFANSESDMIMLSLVWDYHQNIEHNWVWYPNVTSFVNEVRSMAAGDLIEWKGILYRVDGIGFSKVQFTGGEFGSYKKEY